MGALAALDLLLRGMAVAWLLLLAVLLLRERPRVAAARLGAALLLGLCVQVIGSAPLLEEGLPRLWQAPLVAVAVANAPLFWLFVRSLFDDDARLHAGHAAAWLGAAALGFVNCAAPLGPDNPLAQAGQLLQRLVPLLAAAASAWAAAAQRQHDLVEDRRRLRRLILVGGIAYTLLMTGVRIGAPAARLGSGGAWLDLLSLLALSAAIGWRLLQLRPTGLFPAAHDKPAATSLAPGSFVSPTAGPDAPAVMSSAASVNTGAAGTPDTVAVARAPATAPGPAIPAAAVTAEDAAETRLAAALQTAMAEQQAYRDVTLTPATLAARLAVPEYRLRRLINGRLGHRHFSAYVNQWRLQAAQAALADPSQRDKPVLVIALDAGFGSIGPFNRSFKATTGLTPTEFRRQRLADC